MSATANPDGYVLDRTEREYERLRVQAKVWESLTDRVLEQAGLAAGMSVLDAGCGPGEVMRLMARRVGPSGHVTGLDIDAEVGALALQRLREEEKAQFAFHSIDLTDDEDVPGAPFDVVYARFLLIHMMDPVAMTKRLASLVKPGGKLIVMDYVMNMMQVAPSEPSLDRGVEIVQETFRRSGKAVDCGIRFGEWFRAVGLPMPEGTDIEGRLEVSGAENPMLANVLVSLTTPAVALGIATEEEMARLPDEVRAVFRLGEHSMHWPTVTAAWVTVPA